MPQMSGLIWFWLLLSFFFFFFFFYVVNYFKGVFIGDATGLCDSNYLNSNLCFYW